MEDLLGALHESDLVRWHFRGAAQTGLMVPRQTTAGPRRPKQLQWNADILFSVLREHEPDHPLMREARRDALERFLDAPRMLAFLEEARTHRWIFRDLPCISPFGFPLYASRIQEGLAEEDRDAALERIYRAMYDGAAALTTP
jgi:ATP-dependent Lhr-like helicase